MSIDSKVITSRIGKSFQGNDRPKMFSYILRYQVSHRSSSKPWQHSITSDVVAFSKIIQILIKQYNFKLLYTLKFNKPCHF